MRGGWFLLFGVPLAACVSAEPAAVRPISAPNVAAVLEPASNGGVQVRRTVAPAYTMSDGAQAKRDADALCGRVTSTIYDRYEAGVWIFVGGCTG